MARQPKVILEAILEAALADIPGLVTSTLPSSDAGTQLCAEVSWQGTPTRSQLSVFWAGDGWPSDVRAILAQAPKPWPRHLAIGAHHLSPGALELLRREDANWLDEAGNVRLLLPPHIAIIRSPSIKPRQRDRRFAWSASSVSVAEHLLNHGFSEKLDEARSCPLSGARIAEHTRWSPAQVSNILTAFDEHGWTQRHGPKRGPGVWRELVNPGSLLEAWAAHLAEHRPARRLAHGFVAEPMEFLHDRLAPALRDTSGWALTGWGAAQLVAPFLSFVPALQVYVPASALAREPMALLLRTLGLREVEDGANIEFWSIEPQPEPATHGPTGIAVVNTPRLYADLLALGGRATDAAQHLRETQLEY